MDQLPNQTEEHQDYLRIAKAIRFLHENRLAQPSLNDLGNVLHLSEPHLQRMFTRWAGISPKRFLQFLTKEHAKQLLRQHSVADTAYQVGLSGASRLYDLMVQYEAVTPGEYQLAGKNMLIHYGIASSPFGYAFIAWNARGICHLAFFDLAEQQTDAEANFFSEWPLAETLRDDAEANAKISELFWPEEKRDQPIALLLKGTPFQIKVWEALLKIPHGDISSYQDIASQIGSSAAVRAVGSAIARNNIAYLIPCHRVIRSNGDFNQYRWGVERKQALLAWEFAHSSAPVRSV